MNNSNIIYTKNQIDAIKSDEKKVRVIAGAGTGKTTVISERIFYLVEELGVKSESILPITFTKYAATNLKSYLMNKSKNKKLGANFSKIRSFTYHAFSYHILKNYSIGDLYSNYKIKVRFKTVLKSICKKKSNFVRYEDYDIEDIASFIIEKKSSEYALIHEYIVEKIDNELENILDSSDTDEEMKYYQDYLNIFKLYTLDQIKNKYWDFSDLIIYANYILENKDIKKSITNDYKYIFVDEFQDINIQQYKLIKNICDNNSWIFVVGDPDQCIYEWRGSNPKIITNYLTNDFPSLKNYVIDKNYRSNNKILSLANNLIEENYVNNDEISHLFKKLYSDKKSNKNVIFVESNNEDLLRKFILNKILYFKKNNYDLSKIAILYRANYMATQLEWAFKKNKIPFKSYKGTKFWKKTVNHQIIKFLLLLSDKDSSVIRELINVPPRGVGALFDNKVLEYINEHRHVTYDYFVFNYLNKLKFKQNEELKKFLKNVKKYRKKILVKGINPANVLEKFLSNIGYFDHLIKKDSITGKENTSYNFASEFIELIRKHFEENSTDDLMFFINSIIIEGNDRILSSNGVNMLTIHASKGLEFDIVFLFFMNYKLFLNNKYNVEEERRVYYVGATRAKNFLYIMNSDLGFEISKEIKMKSSDKNYLTYNNLDNFNPNKSVFDIYKEEIKKEKTLDNLYSENYLHKNINHPFFGEGYVEKIIQTKNGTLAEVVFRNGKIITLNINFIKKNCKIFDDDNEN